MWSVEFPLSVQAWEASMGSRQRQFVSAGDSARRAGCLRAAIGADRHFSGGSSHVSSVCASLNEVAFLPCSIADLARSQSCATF